VKRHRPRKQKRDFEIEDDEQQRHEIESHVEFHARVVERIEAALVSGQFFRIRAFVSDKERRDQKRAADHRPQDDEHDERKVVGNQARHAASA